MSLFAALFAWVAVGRAADRAAAPPDAEDGMVPSTRWHLEDPDAWNADERDELRELAAALPPSFRQPRRPVTLTRGPAPPLPADLSTPHVVARPRRRGRVIEVGLGGLDARLRDWSEAHSGGELDPTLRRRLVRRQLTHAFTHRADAEAGWSSEGGWTDLSEWDQVLWRERAMETNRLSFANAHGMAGRVEDFATVAEQVLLADALPGDPSLQPRCVLPTKWRFVAERVGGRPPTPAEQCATLADRGLDPERVEAIEVVFVQASMHSSASIAGHSLVTVALSDDGRGGPTRWTFGLVADHSGSEEGTARYVLRGLTGGFPSVVMHEPYARTSLHYSTLEDRDLTRFRLLLDDAQQRAVLARLDELRFGWRRPYSISRRNCTELPRDLVETATGRPVRLPEPFAPDALFAVLTKTGVLDKQRPERLQETSLSSRVDAAERLQADAAARVSEALPNQAAALRRAMRHLDDRPTRRAEAYAALAALSEGLGPHQGAVFADLDRILAWANPRELLGRQRRGALLAKESSPEMDALWAAKAAVRGRAAAHGVQIARLADADAELFAEVERRPHSGTTQTPLRAFGLAPVVRTSGADTSVWLSGAGHFYRSRIGEARAFGMARGLELSLLEGEVLLNTQAPEGRLRQRILAARRLYGRGPVGNPGWYTRLGDIESVLARRSAVDVEVLALGGALELLQLGDHQHHLIAMAGGAAHAAVDPTDLLGALSGWSLGAPVGLSGRVSSPRHALTALLAEAAWEPRWSGSAPASSALRTDAQASVFLGELGGAGVALVARWRGQQAGAPWAPRDEAAPWRHEVGLGVWVEPY